MELPGQFAFSVSATAAGMSDHCANRLPAGKPDLRVMLDPRPESATMRRTQMKTPRWSWMVVAALVERAGHRVADRAVVALGAEQEVDR